jgi:NADH-quinone oxidoreductase subunit D
MGCYLVSNGTNKPYRVKLRGGSYNQLQALPHFGAGGLIADVVAIFASIDVILPEVDR